MKILIVDDSVLIRERIISLLFDLDEIEIIYDVSTAKEAIEYVKNNSVELVILDISLPDENGIYVLEKIKKMNPNIKVIMLTNHPYVQYLIKCKKLGAEYFLHKLTDFNKLPEIIHLANSSLAVN